MGYLDVSAASNFTESFLTLERFVHLIIGHTEHSQLRLVVVVTATLRKHHKVRHERHDDRLRVQLGGHQDSVAWSRAVDEPESATANTKT